MSSIDKYLIRIPESLPPEQHRDFAILTLVGVLGFAAHAVFLVLFLVFEVYTMAYFNIASCALFAMVYFANRKIENDNASFLMALAMGEIVLHAIFATVIIGWDTGFHFYLFLSMITAFLTSRYGGKFAITTNALSFTSYVALFFYTSHFAPLQEISSMAVEIFGAMNLISAASMVIVVTSYYNYIADESTQKYIATNQELSNQKEELQIQTERLEKNNKYTGDSIRYALRIQEATLPTLATLENLFGEDKSMVFYQPKDIISGDFYWCVEKDDKIVWAVGDCTGHGVPGAMLTMIGESLLNSIVLEKEIIVPNKILDTLQTSFSTLFSRSKYEIRDGMDIAICTIDKKNKILQYAGARNPLLYIQNGKANHIRGDKRSIGQAYFSNKLQKEYSLHTISIEQPTTVYLYSDGFQDQFGGEEGRKFYSRNLRKLLHENHQLPMRRQRHTLKRTLFKWRNLRKQTDDVVVMGVQI